MLRPRLRILVLLVGAAFASASYFLFTALKPELSPVEDRGTIISFFIGPEGATINYMEKYARRFEQIFKEHVPEADAFFALQAFGAPPCRLPGDRRLSIGRFAHGPVELRSTSVVRPTDSEARCRISRSAQKTRPRMRVLHAAW